MCYFYKFKTILMEENIIESLSCFHNDYTEIMELRSKLPPKKGKTDYNDQELAIIQKAKNLITRLLKFKKEEVSLSDDIYVEIESIISGCNKFIINPYKVL